MTKRVDIKKTRAAMLRLREGQPDDVALVDQLHSSNFQRAFSGWSATKNRLFVLERYRIAREAGWAVPEAVLADLDVIVSDLLNARTSDELVAAVSRRPKQRCAVGAEALAKGYAELDLLWRHGFLSSQTHADPIAVNERIARETGRKAGGVGQFVKEKRKALGIKGKHERRKPKNI